jgi:serine/threonine protein kinase
MTEIQAMMAVEHPNLLKCIDYGASAVKNPAGKEKQVLYMALELA